MKISIIGCGWLGFPLALKLVEEGHDIHGSTRSHSKVRELLNSGIAGFLFDSEFSEIPYSLTDSEVLILTTPPSGTRDYPGSIRKILDSFSNTTKVIFTSSIGVYKEVEGPVDETGEVDPVHPVYLAEQEVIHSGKPFIILRLAGLIGGERHPVKALAGRNLNDGEKPVNLIQRQDVIAAIRHVMQQKDWGRTFNICFPEHPKRSEYYQKMAGIHQLDPPHFLAGSSGKIVLGERITLQTDFQYTHHIEHVNQ